MSMQTTETYEKEMLHLGNGELDRIVGGVPVPSMILIEGENDTGKSVFVQDVAWGAISGGFSAHYVSTEMAVKPLVNQMENLSYGVLPYFINGKLKITAFQSKEIDRDQQIVSNYLTLILNYIKKRGDADVIIFDSLTYIATHSTSNALLNFLSELRNYIDIKKRIVFVTIHPFAFDSNLLIRIRSVCDGHIIFKVKPLPSNEMARSMEIVKLRGATKASNNLATFKVEPAYGIRVLPFTQVKA